MTEEETKVTDKVLLENLHLFDDDDYLTRAAMLAFYDDPEKWVTGSYIKIGFFGNSDSDLQYQDEVHGTLIEQVDKALDLIYTKYMKALITYRDIQRIEQFMIHRNAVREILLNAVVHKDYSSCNPIQISIYEDQMYIWNDGEMPEEFNSTEKLFQKHSSKPYNPKLANVFFKSCMIEAWGRGFDKIREACEFYGGPLPEYEISKSGIMVLCKACDSYLQLLNGVLGQSEQEHGQENEQDIINKILLFCKEPKTVKEIMDKFNIPNRSYLKRHYMKQMIEEGLLKMTIPEQPRNRNQRYYSSVS